MQTTILKHENPLALGAGMECYIAKSLYTDLEYNYLRKSRTFRSNTKLISIWYIAANIM